MFYLLLEKFNNYKNRINRMASNIYAYEALTGGRYIQNSTKETNFNIRDGLLMIHDFNLEVTDQGDLNPDYLVIYIIRKPGEYPEGDDPELVISRWFVISKRLKSGHQYTLTLKRDVIADNLEIVKESPSFIEKAIIPSSDSAIFNHEDMTFNQIKKSETLIQDATETAWIVGYLAEDHPALTNETFTYKAEVDEVIASDFINWEFSNLCDSQAHISFSMSQSKFENIIAEPRALLLHQYAYIEYNSVTWTATIKGGANDYWDTSNLSLDEYITSNWYSYFNMATIESLINTANPTWVPEATFNRFKKYIGKKIQFNDGIYEITLNKSSALDNDWTLEPTNTNLYNYIYGRVLASIQAVNPNASITDTRNHPFHYKLYKTTFYANATKNLLVPGTYSYSIPLTVKKLNDAPYKMFAIPYYTGDKLYYVSDDGFIDSFKIKKDIMLNWAYDIIKKMGGIGQSGSSAYDLQILPYCPLSEYTTWGTPDYPSNEAGVAVDVHHSDVQVNYDYIELYDSNHDLQGYCFFCDKSTHELELEYYPITISDYKLENECDMYRLCSPNYSSVFEFNPAKNGGVESYIVRFTYKPYQPFIYVAPKFNRLYGEDFKDDRGLILSGDYSLPVISDAWTNYQLTNKNYLLTFDRQIKNLEITQDVQRINEIFGAMAGTVRGGVMGGLGGGMTGNPVGAVSGALIGTVSSLVGGIADYQNNERLRRETIDYTKDQFGYSLRNIQALPNTLNKTSSIIAISKLFPFVEKYTCTDEEKEALINKIRYNGMTVMRIGKIKDYIGYHYPLDNHYTYIKAKLIRNQDIACDSNFLEAISEELDKGVNFE